MDNIEYYTFDRDTLGVTNNFNKVIEQSENSFISIDRYEKISDIKDLEIQERTINNLSFRNFHSENCLELIKYIQNKFDLNIIAFNHTKLNLYDIKLKTKQIVVNENVSINFNNINLESIEEITFTDLKSYDGEISDNNVSLKKLMVWHDRKAISKLIYKFPSIQYFFLTKSSVEELLFSKFNFLELVELNYCSKLKNIEFEKKPTVKFSLHKCPMISLPPKELNSLSV